MPTVQQCRSRSRRLVVGIAALAVAVPLTGCGSSADRPSLGTLRDPATTSTTEPVPVDGVRLLSSGSAPQEVAAMALEAGRTSRLALAGSGRSELVEITTYQPSGDYPEGPRISLQFRILRVEVEGVDPATLQPLTDLGGTGDLTTAGALTDLTFAAPATLHADARRELRSLTSRLTQLAVPLPGAPIGVGARWQRFGDPTATFRLLRRDGQTLSYEVVQRGAADRATGTITYREPLSTLTSDVLVADRIPTR